MGRVGAYGIEERERRQVWPACGIDTGVPPDRTRQDGADHDLINGLPGLGLWCDFHVVSLEFLEEAEGSWQGNHDRLAVQAGSAVRMGTRSLYSLDLTLTIHGTHCDFMFPW